ncbi:FG-GAP repeat protein, partial [Candidatus Woesearchaeota archaeon]|nr:FG-GAP repeat protein [Candidatus Woesearchaeota archaeon]
ETWIEEQKINASDGETQDKFGTSVSITQNYAIIGAYGKDDKGNNSGSAYVFDNIGSIWNLDEKITAFDGEEEDAFGFSVSIEDDYGIIGACFNDEFCNNSGSAYVFRGHNQPPNIPTISGPGRGIPDKKYEYKFSSIDPEGDDIKYHIDWGDNNISTDFYPSGINLWLNYTWSQQGDFTIKVKTEDICGLVSPEATFEVILPRTKKASIITIPNFFKQHLNLFSIFKLFLYRLGLNY